MVSASNSCLWKNNRTNDSCPSSCSIPADMDIPYITAEVFIAVLALFSNGLVCGSVLRCGKLRTVTNTFLVSLAVADILVGVVVVPSAILSDLGIPLRTSPICVPMTCSLLVLTQASIFGLLLISVERFIAVMQPLSYNVFLRPARVCQMICGSWVLAFAVGLVPMMGWNKKPKCDSTPCMFKQVITNTYIVYFNFLCFILVPLLIMLVLYGQIFWEARQQIRRWAVKSPEVAPECRDKLRPVTLRKEVRTAFSLGLLILAFCICWLPLYAINCYELFTDCYTVPDYIIKIAIILSHANSVVNPALYVFRLRSFRFALRRALGCPPGQSWPPKDYWCVPQCPQPVKKNKDHGTLGKEMNTFLPGI
ncbi:adenosine receptor A2b-like [Erpetoichthys calabaricus]|uniref:adenosine receptor A2b-like n=1 Tax=Erpetoichthys calabaricus TaxID=27687 RepID=UPI002233F1D1|nr:adenosine receptor A2b-like [Erpetoichthys calabaricus]